MSYLLDTCTISDFVKGQPAVLKRTKVTSPTLIFVSSISTMEIEYGLRLNPARVQKILPVIQAFLANIQILPFGNPEAKAAGGIRAALRRQGSPIGCYDVLIAGTALAHGLTVVTSNTNEFKRVGGLLLENWRE